MKGPSTPVVKLRVPWATSEGREIDLTKPPWDSLAEASLYGERVNRWIRDGKWYDGPLNIRVIRT